MRAARRTWPLDAAKVERNRAIVQAKSQELSDTKVAQMFGVSTARVRQICTQAARRERFAREHAESGGRARVRTLGNDAEAPRDDPKAWP